MEMINGVYEKCAEEIADINAIDGGKITIDRLAAVKTYGIDNYSRMNEEKLVSLIGKDTMETIKKHFRKATNSLQAARWVARGLHVNLAIDKIKAEQKKTYFCHIR